MTIDVDDPLWALFGRGQERHDDDDHALRGPQRQTTPQPPEPAVRAGGASWVCPHCRAAAPAPTVLEGNEVCQACRTVVGRFLDHSAEWRCFTSDDSRGGADPTRCCPAGNALLPTLGCVVSGGGGGGRGGGGGGGGGETSRLIQKYQIWHALTYRERSLCGVFDALAVHAAQHGFSACILEEAKTLYKAMSEGRVSRGESRSALVAACLYMACKSNRVPRSVREVAAVFDVKESAMAKACRLFEAGACAGWASASAPADYVSRFCSRLGIDGRGTALCRAVVERVEELALLPECMPPSVVAGVIELVAEELGLALTRDQIGATCHVSPVTAHKCCKRLQPFRAQLLGGGGAPPHPPR